MPAETILSPAILPEPWARDRLRLGADSQPSKRRGHANQLLDPAGKRGSRWNWPQLAVYRCARAGSLGTSGEDLNAILIAVRNDVMRQTDRQQVPSGTLGVDSAILLRSLGSNV